MVAVARDVQEALQQVRLLADESKDGFARCHKQCGGHGGSESGRQRLVVAEEVGRGEGTRCYDRFNHHPIAPFVDEVGSHTPFE